MQVKINRAYVTNFNIYQEGGGIFLEWEDSLRGTRRVEIASREAVAHWKLNDMMKARVDFLRAESKRYFSVCKTDWKSFNACYNAFIRFGHML